MKKFTLIACTLMCAILIFSCNRVDPVTFTFTIDTPTDIEFNADGTGGYPVITVDANQEWDFTLMPADGNGWLTASRSGNQVSLTAEPNTGATAPASVTILFTPVETSPVLVTVKQLAAESALSVDPFFTELIFNADGTSDQMTSFTVSTNESSWSVTLSPSDIWLSANKSGNTFTLTAEPNALPDAPDPVTVTVSAGGAAPVVFTAIQAGAASADKYAVGDLWPDGDAPEGIVFWLDASHGEYDPVMKKGTKGKIISLDEASLKWSITPAVQTNASDMYDGMANMSQVRALDPDLNNHPALKWCADKGEKWYMPAVYELEYVSCAFNDKPFDIWTPSQGDPSWSADTTAQAAFNATLTSASGDPIGSYEDYWSSTENTAVRPENALTITLSHGWMSNYQKDNTTPLVRAVAAFE